MKKFELWHGDCLELMKNIPDGSVDLVLTDPPYGTMKGIDDKHDWDIILPTKEMFEQLSRIVRQNGKVVLFSQEPYTSHLINNAIVSLPFCYRAIWKKDSFGNGRMAKKAMVSLYEDILIFQNKCPNKENCEATIAFQKVIDRYGFYEIADLMFAEGRYKDVASARKNLSKKRINDFSEKDYDNFLDERMLLFLADKIELEFSPDWYLQKAKEYKQKYAMTFNLWQGGKSKSNVLEYKKDNDGYHPTQKPVALLEDLIKTYSNEGNTVLDFTAGSMSTVIACINTNRNCIAIEKDAHYFSVGCERVHNHILDNNIDEGYFNIDKKRIEEAVNDLP